MKKTIRYLLVAVGLILVVGLGAIFALRPAPQNDLPNPNGYDDFIAASRLTQGDFMKASDLDHAGLKGFLLTNAPALQRWRVGLTHQSAVPTWQLVTNFTVSLHDLLNQNQLAMAAALEGKFAEQENRTNDAIRDYLNVIRFGDEMSRGGFIMNRLVGVASEARGLNPLIKLAPELTCEQSRTIIVELENIEHNGVTWTEVMKAERIIFWHELEHPSHPIALMSGWRDRRNVNVLSRRKHDTINARLRLLTVELALRCYRAEHGSAPATLNQLVPKYLQSVPADPYSQSPLAYQPNGTNWQMQSVGFPGTNGVNIPILVVIPDPTTTP